MENVNLNKQYFEFCAYYDASLYDMFLDEAKQIKNLIKDYNGVCVNLSGENINQFLVAVSCENREKVENELKKFFTNLYINYFKENYLKNNLKNLYKLEQYEKLFIKVLTYFDRETDILDIEKNFKLTSKFYVKEFFYFKLKNMTKRWSEVCALTNENSHFFDTESLLYELIKFLISNMKPKNECVLINILNDKIEICNSENKLVNNYSQIDKNSQIDIICELLSDFPKKIKISGNLTAQKEFLKLVNSIFKNVIKIEYLV